MDGSYAFLLVHMDPVMSWMKRRKLFEMMLSVCSFAANVNEALLVIEILELVK